MPALEPKRLHDIKVASFPHMVDFAGTTVGVSTQLSEQRNLMLSYQTNTCNYRFQNFVVDIGDNVRTVYTTVGKTAHWNLQRNLFKFGLKKVPLWPAVATHSQSMTVHVRMGAELKCQDEIGTTVKVH